MSLHSKHSVTLHFCPPSPGGATNLSSTPGYFPSPPAAPQKERLFWWRLTRLSKGEKFSHSANLLSPFWQEDEFWGRPAAGPPWTGPAKYDSDAYAALRSEYCAGALPDLFAKVCEAARPPPPDGLGPRLARAVARMLM